LLSSFQNALSSAGFNLTLTASMVLQAESNYAFSGLLPSVVQDLIQFGFTTAEINQIREILQVQDINVVAGAFPGNLTNSQLVSALQQGAQAFFSFTSLTASPNILWPPNHKMVSVLLTASVSGSPAVCQITDVNSNEPPSVPGETDWAVTGPLNVNLRAERDGFGNGRVYTLTVTCTTPSLFSTSKTVTVSVPHDQR
jgi:hypothetical protein